MQLTNCLSCGFLFNTAYVLQLTEDYLSSPRKRCHSMCAILGDMKRMVMKQMQLYPQELQAHG